MKTVCTISLLFLAGMATAQTTLEEYNYVTKGYKIQVESGLDMKKGYVMKDLFEVFIRIEINDSPFGVAPKTIKTTAKGLYRTGQTSPCAIMLIESAGSQIGKPVCIPHYLSEESIWELYTKSIRSGYDARAISAVTARCAAYFAQNN